MEMKIPVEIRCGSCGQKSLEASGDTLTDDSVVTCTSCGQKVGTWGNVKQHALEASADQIKKRLADALGDSFKPS
jgi:DNA-directed RNA polymerase subunit N (RpoN/RPB10)